MGFVGHGPVSASRVVISLHNVRARVSAVPVDGSVRGRGEWWKVESSVRRWDDKIGPEGCLGDHN